MFFVFGAFLFGFAFAVGFMGANAYTQQERKDKDFHAMLDAQMREYQQEAQRILNELDER